MDQEYKICSKCNLNKPITEFHFRKDNNNKPCNRCKKCKYARQQKLKFENYEQYLINDKKSYNKNKIRKLKTTKLYYYKNKILLNEHDFKRRLRKKLYAIIKLGSYCKHCNCNLINEPWNADFHHLDPTLKESTIARLYDVNKMTKLDLELEKCILLCSNCHRKIHYNYDLYLKIKDEILKELS